MSKQKDDGTKGVLGRRDLLRATAALGAFAGAGALAGDAKAMRLGRRPGPRGHIQRATMTSELGDVIEGKIDLFTLDVRTTRTAGQSVQFEFEVDTLAAGTTVTELTDKIEKLALVNPELHRPPEALVAWGNGFGFKGVLETSHTGFMMFKEDGTPLRARVQCTFQTTEPGPN